jgi:hypothetical protein
MPFRVSNSRAIIDAKNDSPLDFECFFKITNGFFLYVQMLHVKSEKDIFLSHIC